MPHALAIIQQEHRNLRALLNCLESLVDDVAKNDLLPDLAVFDLIFDYLGSYLDRYHHPKEDTYLFAALRKRDPGAAVAIDALEAEHRMEPSMLAKMRTALEDYRSNGAPALPRLRDAIRAYVEFERSHAMKEEDEIFSRAKSVLTEEDWVAIEDAFAANEDPLFGEGPTHRYRTLFTEISSRVPAPHGFGRAWPPRS
ncbi:MAG: hemerythrin domain-containing protein [Alphaproteobacteria bacterium]|nr:hemerythrin domain-containing protein [Alphaproteobacteria bacterium]